MEQQRKVVPQYDVTSCVAQDLSETEIDSCLRIIEEGCAVNPGAAKKELPLAQVLAIARSGVEIVAIGAIKRERPRYATDIARRSAFQFDKQTAELGYIAVDARHRGNDLSHAIVAKLLSNKEGPLFATTDSDFMKGSLKKAGFKQQGKEWKGERGRLSLWITKTKRPTGRGVS